MTDKTITKKTILKNRDKAWTPIGGGLEVCISSLP